MIGLPGETVELRNKKVYIDGKLIDEPYVQYLFTPSDEEGPFDFDVRMQYGPVTVPAGQYFMMGDNRDNSQDSRYWGFLPREYVKGKALFVYFSFGEEGCNPSHQHPLESRPPSDSLEQTASFTLLSARFSVRVQVRRQRDVYVNT